MTFEVMGRSCSGFPVVLLAFLLCACGPSETRTKAASKDSVAVMKAKDSLPEEDDEFGISAPEDITDPKMKSMLSVPDTLWLGDTLTIRFRVPHPTDLAVFDPDDKFFFVVYDGVMEGGPPLVPPGQFARMDRLQLLPGVTANIWTAGVKEPQPIFTRAGTYELRLSEELETDDGTPVETETVYYTGRKR